MQQSASSKIRPVSQREPFAAVCTLLKQHIGTLQLLLLTAFFAAPLFFGFHVPFFSQDTLDEILVFEFGVLMYGFYLAGFLYLPVALTDSVWVRRICLLLGVALAVPLTSGFWHGYGFLGFLGFCLLLFANYSAVFIASVSFMERTKLAIEAALRCVVYMLIFIVVTVALDMRTNIENWSGNKALMFGSIYFGVLVRQNTGLVALPANTVVGVLDIFERRKLSFQILEQRAVAVETK